MTDHATIIMECLGRAPHTKAEIASALHLRGSVRTEDMYTTATKLLREMQDAEQIERFGDGLNTGWRLPASTPFETKKAPR